MATERVIHGNGEGDTWMKESIIMKHHLPFSFINIGQRGKIFNSTHVQDAHQYKALHNGVVTFSPSPPYMC